MRFFDDDDRARGAVTILATYRSRKSTNLSLSLYQLPVESQTAHGSALNADHFVTQASSLIISGKNTHNNTHSGKNEATCASTTTTTTTTNLGAVFHQCRFHLPLCLADKRVCLCSGLYSTIFVNYSQQLQVVRRATYMYLHNQFSFSPTTMPRRIGCCPSDRER